MSALDNVMSSAGAPDRSENPTDPLDSLEQELTALAGHLNAGNYRFLKLLAEFERRNGHVGWGIQSCAHWLSWKCSIGLVAARDKVRVARALEALPKLSDAMRRGTLSYCKVRALTRIATPQNEELLLSLGEAATVSHVEKAVRLYRRTERAQHLATANAQHADRHVQCYVDADGSVVIRGRLTPEHGALVMKALASAGDTLREAERDSREACAPPDSPVDAHGARQADALALLAETFLAQGAAPLAAAERHQVIVHVAEAVLREAPGDEGVSRELSVDGYALRERARSERGSHEEPSDKPAPHEVAGDEPAPHGLASDGLCEIADVAALPVATARRLCCEANVVRVIESETGDVLNVGRRTRVVPTALRRALAIRDAGCRFPGCTNRRFVEAHHVVHWADGGDTKQDNLVLLCRRHHRFVHEYGFTIVRDSGVFCFVRPDGRRVVEAPGADGVDSDAGWLALQRAHRELGLRIDDATAAPQWRGERVDYDWVVGSLQARAAQPCN